EFPWRTFVHDKRASCASMSLKLREGATGDFSEVILECTCGASRRMLDATAEEANPECKGNRPWLGPEAVEECHERMRLLVRTASNSYFPLSESALSIPAKTADDLVTIVRASWG